MHRGVRRLQIAILAATVVAVVAGTGGVAFGGPAHGAKAPKAKQVPAVKHVTAVPTRFTTAKKPKPYTPTKMTWPKAVSGTVALNPGVRATVSGAPVWAQAVGSSGKGPTSLHVAVLDHKMAAAADVPGVLMTVSADQAGKARLGVDYGSFAEAYGGNFAGGLALVRYPACVLTTPTVAACRTATPLPSSNDMEAQTVAADVVIPAASAASTRNSVMVLAAAAATTPAEGGAPGGTDGATSLKPSNSWTGGGGAGSFTYNYPIALADGPSSLVPSMALGYNSATTDGETAATQSQSSWVGEGWNLPDSYVEQSFQSCSESPEGLAAPATTYDQCYDGPIYNLSVNGSTTALVWDATAKVFKADAADGAVVVHYCTLPSGKTTFSDPTCTAGTSNASSTYFNDWWKVTERDGTAYSFGLNHLPGWVSGKTATNSVAYQPVYSAHSGDPCYNATFSSAVCTMPYRWGLDYTTDTHGNAMAYYYHQDTNNYGAYNGASVKTYVRDQYLTNIDFGFTDGNAYGTVPNKVVFKTDVRCVSGTCSPLNATNAPNWPDVPFTDICSSTTSCTDHSPTYFSTVRLGSIVSQQYSLTGVKYIDLDTYTLSQSMPQTGDGTARTLWLDSIVHSAAAQGAGTSSTPAITLPPITFTATAPMANRLDTQSDGLPAYFKYRLGKVTTETGSNITISYYLPNPCSATAKPTPATNTSSCYPVSWTPDSYTAPITDWFNKYAVKQISQDDPTGGASAQVTSYDYVGGAAWHYDDNELVKAKYRNYGQFRGYGDVLTYAGDGVTDAKAKTESTYYRGMSKNNNTTAVNLTDSLGGVHEDIDQLSGKALETSSFLGSAVDNSTITSYWVSDAAATRTRSGLPSLTSNWVAPVETYARQAVTGSGATAWRYNETDTSYVASTTDGNFGVPVRVYTHTSPANAAYDTCATTTYAPANTAKNLVGLVAETETDSVGCGGYVAGSKPSAPGSVNALTAPATVSRPAQVVSDVRNFYDDPTFATTFPQATAPAKGDVTMVRKAADYTGGAFTWLTTERAKYDSVGRKTDAYNGNGNDTVTTYTTNSIGLLTTTKVTNALNQSVSTTLDTQRGLALTKSDPNSVITTNRYDALGRVVGTWLNNRDATSTAANSVYTYAISNSGPTAVTTQQLGEGGVYKLSTLIYDGLLRPRQTQTGTPSGGRLVTDTFYDTRGWVSAKYTNWWDSDTTPTTTTVSAANLHKQVPMQNLYTHDSLGRTVIDQNQNNGVNVSRTTTVYNGDRTTFLPPDGGTATTTDVDPLGRTTEVDNYMTRPTLTSPSDPFTGVFSVAGGTAQITSYGYDGHGNQSTATQGAAGSGGPTWTTTFNVLGQATSKMDPDAGTSSNITYDNAGNLTQSTDGRGKTTSYTYDVLSRKTGAFASTVASQQAGATGNQTAAWVYDNANNVANVTNAVGQLSTSISYQGGNTYTTQQTGFNTLGESLGTSVTIPSVTGETALAGTYTVKHTYTTIAGLPLKDIYLVGGGLPAEQTLHTYTSVYDLPDSLTGLASYTQTTSYDALSRVSETKLGPSTTVFDNVDNAYDPNNGRLTDQLVNRTLDGGTTVTAVDDQAYRYDDAGNLTRQINTRQGSAATAETQCFGYDGLDQLVNAWTANDSCATAPTAGNSSMVADGLGPNSAYWTSWTIDGLGDRSNQTRHAFAGGPSADTSVSYGYGTGSSQPHTLTSTTTTGAVTGTTSYGYDAGGNMTSRNSGQGAQTIGYDDSDRLTGVSGSTGGASTYTYDADGTLLEQHDPGSVTLYIGDQQFTLNTTTSAVTGVRYYALPGGGRAVRTGTTAASFGFELADQHGTPTLYLDNTADNPRWRQFTPYGEARGTAVTAPDNRGFLNKAIDSNTGLSIVGARQYDPTVGRFITVDPLLELNDPTQLNGYGYAGNNPIVRADPTGLRTDDQYFGPTASANIEKNAEQYNNATILNSGVGFGRKGNGHSMDRHRSLARAGHHSSGVYVRRARKAECVGAFCFAGSIRRSLTGITAALTDDPDEPSVGDDLDTLLGTIADSTGALAAVGGAIGCAVTIEIGCLEGAPVGAFIGGGLGLVYGIGRGIQKVCEAHDCLGRKEPKWVDPGPTWHDPVPAGQDPTKTGD